MSRRSSQSLKISLSKNRHLPDSHFPNTMKPGSNNGSGLFLNQNKLLLRPCSLRTAAGDYSHTRPHSLPVQIFRENSRRTFDLGGAGPYLIVPGVAFRRHKVAESRSLIVQSQKLGTDEAAVLLPEL